MSDTIVHISYLEDDEYECLYTMIHMRKAKWGTDDRETRESHDGSALLHP